MARVVWWVVVLLVLLAVGTGVGIHFVPESCVDSCKRKVDNSLPKNAPWWFKWLVQTGCELPCLFDSPAPAPA
jgi:hypothetical protein